MQLNRPHLVLHLQQVPPLHRGRPHPARCADSGGGAAEAGGEAVRQQPHTNCIRPARCLCAVAQQSQQSQQLLQSYGCAAVASMCHQHDVNICLGTVSRLLHDTPCASDRTCCRKPRISAELAPARCGALLFVARGSRRVVEEVLKLKQQGLPIPEHLLPPPKADKPKKKEDGKGAKKK